MLAESVSRTLFTFFERARTEYLRTLNFSQQSLLQEQQLAFVVKTMFIDYCIPANWMIILLSKLK